MMGYPFLHMQSLQPGKSRGSYENSNQSWKLRTPQNVDFAVNTLYKALGAFEYNF